VRGIKGKAVELNKLLQKRHIKIAVINETKKKLQGIKDTRNYSITYSEVEENITPGSG
jgi:ribosomal protein L34E